MLALQVVFMFTLFNYDSPAELVSKGEDDKLRELMSKLYYGKEIEKRIKQIRNGGDNKTENEELLLDEKNSNDENSLYRS